jgi:hypothetical protein
VSVAGTMPAMKILSSPRRRRRLLIAAAVLAVAVPLVLLVAFYSTPADQGAATGPVVTTSAPAEPKHAPFTKANQRAVHKVLHDFIETAVVRRDVERSWDLAAPGLRAGLTREQWAQGKLPVVPYPAADTKTVGGWDAVEYSYRRTVGLEVFLFPKPGSGVSAMTADVELVKGHDGRWRVDYWMPNKFHGPPAVAKTKQASSPQEPSKTATKRKASGRPSAAAPLKPSRVWWVVPIGVLSLIVLAPLGIGVGIWYRNRRAAREYARGS